MRDQLLDLRLVGFKSELGIVNAGDTDARIFFLQNLRGLLSSAGSATQQVDRSIVRAGGRAEGGNQAGAGHPLRQWRALEARGPDQRHTVGDDERRMRIERSKRAI